MSPAVPTAPIAPLSLTRSDGGVLTLDGSRCVIMGILNLTPDSFSDGGRLTDVTAALRHAERLVAEGAEILDFGAESTRPGARLLSVDEEWQRLRPVVQSLPTLQLPAVLSIDTRHAETARRVHELGFRLLNLAFPQHLRELTDYDGDLCETVEAELSLAARMLTDDSPPLLSRILYDPGLGFAKTAEQSLTLLHSTAALRSGLARPILVGASRKSMWGALTSQPVESRLIPSVMGAAFAASCGADIVRVHDVAETKQALVVARALSIGRHGP